MVGDERAGSGPEIVATRSIFYPDSERVMGWDISEAGFRIVLSADVPQVVRDHLRVDVDEFLGDHGLRRADIGCWISHPGGPKVLEATADALELEARRARRHLEKPSRSRQPVVDLGSPRPRRHAREPSASSRNARRSARHGPGLLLGAGSAALLSGGQATTMRDEPSSSWFWFTLLVLLVAIARVAELGLAARNRRRLLARGARESAAGHYPWMVAVQTTWLLATVAEVWTRERPFIPALGYPMLALLGLGFALRYWVIATLGERWTTRILTLPGAPLIARGPYRFLRHPNYLAVSLEVAALPLVHTAWWSAVFFSLANAIVLRVRIRPRRRRSRRPPCPVLPGQHSARGPDEHLRSVALAFRSGDSRGNRRGGADAARLDGAAGTWNAPHRRPAPRLDPVAHPDGRNRESL